MSMSAIDLNIEYLPRLPREERLWHRVYRGSGFIMRDCRLVAYQNSGFKPVAITSRNRAHAEAYRETDKIMQALQCRG